ncbi:MAG: TPM domain-containing protein [Rhizobiaceae bacterium]|nr:TPM domain-containing protein [Rhizobiaceae bacterium]
MVIFTHEEHKQIAAAIQLAERQTSGEIHCAVCRQSDSYFLAAGFVFSAVTLMVGLLFAWLFYWLWIDIDLRIFVTAQFIAYGSGLLILYQIPRLRLLLVPKSLRYRRAHANAMQQFFAQNTHRTQARTGVLVFVSLAERYAEVVADGGISDKVSQDQWNTIVADLIAGAAEKKLAHALINAVEQIQTILIVHFPPSADNPNELPDHVIEI